MAKTQALSTKTQTNPLDLLSVKQRLYVEARVQGMSPRSAAKAAGVADGAHISDEYEAHPKVKAAIKEINAKALRKLQITREDVLEGFMDAVRTAATSTELVGAWREIGKIIGAYEPVTVKISHEMLMPENLRTLTDAQLAQLAGMQGVTIDGDCEPGD